MKKDGRRANDNRPGFNQKRPVLEPTSPGENVYGIVYHIFPDGQVPMAWNPNAAQNAAERRRKMKQLLFPGFFGRQTEEDPNGYIFVRYVKRKDGKIIWSRKGSVLRIPRSSLKSVA